MGKVIQTYKNDGIKISYEKIKRWTLDILDGLDYLHNTAKNIHFDIKPENIFLNELDRCRIGDLGLARNYESLTSFNMRGTLCYMSPELVKLDGNTKIDFKTDIWSFGCVFYEMITLEKAFYHKSPYELQKNIVETPIEIPDNINPEFKDILEMYVT